MDSDTYKRIVEACFPQLPVREARRISEGWDSVALEVNGEYIFRFPKRPDVEPQYEMEVRLLAELAERLPAPVPRFEFVWPGGAAYAMRFVGYRKLAGAPLDRAGLLPDQLSSLAAQLGAFLSALHGFPAERAALLLAPGGDTALEEGWAARWRRRYREIYAQARADVLPRLEAAPRSRVARLWEAFLEDDAHFCFRPAPIHCDLSADHILCDPGGASISGVIDWGDATIGDPAIDFVGLLADCGAPLAEQALDAYHCAVDATFRRRMQFYLRAMPVNEVLFGAANGLAEHVRQGLADLRAAFAEDG